MTSTCTFIDKEAFWLAIDFIYVFRITEANVYKVWQIANVSADEDLMRACVPMLVWQCSATPIVPQLLEATELGGLNCLLSNERSQRLSALWRVSAVAAWLNAAPTKESQQHRTNAFADLVALIQFDGISMHEAAKIFFDRYFRLLPAFCK